jgi:putative tryptophan/tyrosine transport system substrate-binding protein
MKRRRFISLLGGAAASWPVAANAQQDRMRRLAVILGVRENDPEAQVRAFAIRQGLQEFGWIEGRNLQIEFRWTRTTGDAEARVKELVALAPDVILNGSTPAMTVFKREGKIPVVFVQIPDPVGAGLIASLARPGGHMTGFTSYEHTIGSKWLGLLKEASPSLSRIVVLINPFAVTWSEVFRRMEVLAPSLGVQLTAAPVRNSEEIERAINEAARDSGAGLIAFPGAATALNRAQIIALAARHRLPAIYPYRYFVTSGGVMSYGIDTVYLHRQTASYIDRILKGAKPADLPVQAPTKFELVINLQTAKALGLTVPPTLLARADEVIE